MMKATINGITVEGTPEEIAEYQKHMDDLRREGVYIKPPLGQPPGWLKQELVKATIKNHTKNCPANGFKGLSCYCTGACK